MDRFYNLEKEAVLRHFNVTERGLNQKQVQENQKKYGKNILEEKPRPSKARIFLEQFQDLLVIILIIAALISLFTGELESTIVIFSVITLNAVIGTYQHLKAEKSLRSLKKLSSPHARVIREGRETLIPASDVVVGDIVSVKAGDIVAADGRIIYARNLEVNESSLTGESQAVEKDEKLIPKEQLAIADQKNMLFSGTVATSGKALFVVTRVGMETELGKIARMLGETKPQKTPLQVSLDEFSKKLAFIIIFICLAIFLLSIYRKIALLDSLMFAVALAVAAIPEALSSIVTIVLAIGTQKMAEEAAIIKELKAVEGLGCVTVICSDKTGTLTQNRMEVREIHLEGRLLPAASLDLRKENQRLFLLASYLCNDSVGAGHGDATEIALLRLAKLYNVDPARASKKYPRVSELPFDSARKIMSTLNLVDGKRLLFVKGAGDVVLRKANRIYGDGIRYLTAGDRYEINRTIRQLSEKGYRVLGLAYKECALAEISNRDESQLIFLGLVTMVDPPRPEARAAIQAAKQAGIKPVMITGDHLQTAQSIAKEVGIFGERELALSGEQLEGMHPYELQKQIKSVAVYARVSPEHKIRIVEGWQKAGGIVAFVGDGINDAPALRKADIGIAMGLSGTEVSKEASSIILTDDNYFTIIKAVRNGRKIYNNIQNAITFLISGNAAAILLVVYTSLLNLPIPFAPVHLLFINLLTDSLPAIAIGMEEDGDDLLKKPPRDPKQSLLSKRVLKIIAFEGFLIAAFTLLSYHIGLKNNHYVARTMVFGTLCLARLFHSFNCRGTKSIFEKKIKNKAMLISFMVGALLLNLALFVPFFQKIFLAFPLSSSEAAFMFVNAALPTVILQIILFFRYKKRKRAR